MHSFIQDSQDFLPNDKLFEIDKKLRVSSSKASIPVPTMLMPAESPCQAHAFPLIRATAITRRHLLVVDVRQRTIRKHSVLPLLLIDNQTSPIVQPLLLAAPSAKKAVAPET